MSTEENRTIVRRVTSEVVSDGNLAAADELIAPNYVYHGTGVPDMHGVEGFKQVIAMYRTALPDLQLTIEDMIAEGDKVATRFVVRGTHRGPLLDVAPTGKQITVAGIFISRIVGGKIAEEWENLDALGMMHQLGAIPGPTR